jgi:DNA polymerase-3 subunit gamma/tau
MGQALYRKYRSKSLKEIVGQEHITETLSEALKQGRISHAYLFTGPRGVGKTSIARILAHEINGIPYFDDSAHLDIIEIDAASNRRIDEIRELRDKVYVAPTSVKYKVYIIDEVHMLTREAFNALLKTLEEPPEHAVFILATTDAHKLPETIVSRTQRFKPVEKPKVVAHLKDIAKSEGIKVSDDALELLAEHGEGSFRDSISLLDQASSHGKELKLTDVQQLLGLPPEQALNSLLGSLGKDGAATIMQQIMALYDQGFQAAAIAKQLGHLLRDQLVNGKLKLDKTDALNLLHKLLNVPAAHNPERFLEI